MLSYEPRYRRSTSLNPDQSQLPSPPVTGQHGRRTHPSDPVRRPCHLALPPLVRQSGPGVSAFGLIMSVAPLTPTESWSPSHPRSSSRSISSGCPPRLGTPHLVVSDGAPLAFASVTGSPTSESKPTERALRRRYGTQVNRALTGAMILWAICKSMIHTSADGQPSSSSSSPFSLCCPCCSSMRAGL